MGSPRRPPLNAQLDAEEKLFGLGTSKIRQLWLREHIYRRGENLTAAADLTATIDASHGTGVASILLGGQPGLRDRIGLAPGADYIGYAQVDEARMGLVFADAAERGAVLMLREWSQPVGVVGDGGSIFEASMDAARERGMLQVCPLGNLNSAGKPIELSADGQVELAFTVGDGFFDGRHQLPYGYVQAHVARTSDARPEALQIIRLDGSTASCSGAMASRTPLSRAPGRSGWRACRLKPPYMAASPMLGRAGRQASAGTDVHAIEQA
ncbi:MAG: hypothetical protein ACI9U2_003753 [Bradymonadia bacterium]|jgi:hypothetical protein